MSSPESSKPRGSLLAMVLVLLFVLVCTAALVFLTFGYFLLVLVIGAGVFGLAGFHYVVWGWWLTQVIRREEEEEERREREERGES
jgi:hypothetical protein